MNKLIRSIMATCLFVFCVFNALNAQVGVNILTTHTSAAMQIASPPGSFRGLLLPAMSPYNRVGISSGTNTAADGLMVYDSYHKMPYYFNSTLNRWTSMSPFLLTTGSSTTYGVPFGTITTPAPASPVTYSVGINTQNPAKELDVAGNAGVSGDVTVGYNASVGGALNVGGNFTKTGFPVNPLVPSGTIVMWHGSTLPAGWAECNGANGTPDLRGRFIVAAGQATSTTVPGDLNPYYSPNAKGGENRHVLTKSETPKHAHNMNGDGSTVSAYGGSHSHGVAKIAGVTGVVGGSGKNVIPDNGNGSTTSPSSHGHPTSDFSGKTGDGTGDGLNNQPHENRPQYYVLRFIMKL